MGSVCGRPARLGVAFVRREGNTRRIRCRGGGMRYMEGVHQTVRLERTVITDAEQQYHSGEHEPENRQPVGYPSDMPHGSELYVNSAPVCRPKAVPCFRPIHLCRNGRLRDRSLPVRRRTPRGVSFCCTGVRIRQRSVMSDGLGLPWCPRFRFRSGVGGRIGPGGYIVEVVRSRGKAGRSMNGLLVRGFGR